MTSNLYRKDFVMRFRNLFLCLLQWEFFYLFFFFLPFRTSQQACPECKTNGIFVILFASCNHFSVGSADISVFLCCFFLVEFLVYAFVMQLIPLLKHALKINKIKQLNTFQKSISCSYKLPGLFKGM